MAKERVSKVDKKPKKEKKLSSEDKVKKSNRKQEKVQESYESDVDLGMTTEEATTAAETALRHATSMTESSNHQFELPLMPKGEKGTATTTDDMEVDNTNGGILEPTELTAEEMRAARKLRKKEQALQEEIHKRLMAQELGPSITESGRHIEAEKARRAKKKAEKRAAKEALNAQSGGASVEQASENEVTPLFAIDIAPTKVDLEKLKAEAPTGDNSMGDGESQAGLNRAARRRLLMIEKQRKAIRKALAVPNDSNEPSDEVEARLESWTALMDEKTAERNAKKRIQKEKEATRLRNKRGKILTGRKLVEKKKDMKKNERRKPNQLSRQ